ncbi:hypothetical protein ZIOFF_066398 [Zingiber officinale]|uniref:Uncharacterized protein n=1 Tax=Zingiber officinale TaxID=94328 RepID=A0A8J5EY91_ZINOF|nr:hypothetical protein ZIOFF_066398 [Zingiber officinale]
MQVQIDGERNHQETLALPDRRRQETLAAGERRGREKPSGLSENPSSPKDSTTTTSNHSSSSKTGLELFLACLGVAIIILLSFFLFKMWQKRRREEQYARLLKLFEEDNELEVELGLRD